MAAHMKTTYDLSTATFAKWTNGGSIQLNRKRWDRLGRLLSSTRKVYIEPMTLPIILEKSKTVLEKLREVEWGIHETHNISLYDNHVIHISKLYRNLYIGLHWLDEDDEIITGPGINLSPEEWENLIEMLKDKLRPNNKTQINGANGNSKPKKRRIDVNTLSFANKKGNGKEPTQSPPDGASEQSKLCQLDGATVGKHHSSKQEKNKKGKVLCRQYSLPNGALLTSPEKEIQKTCSSGTVEEKTDDAEESIVACAKVDEESYSPSIRPSTLPFPDTFTVNKFAFKWHIPGDSGSAIQSRWYIDPELCELEGAHRQPADPKFQMYVDQQAFSIAMGKNLFNAAFAQLIKDEMERQIEKDKLTYTYDAAGDDWEIYGKSALAQIVPMQISTLCERAISFYQFVTDDITANLQSAFSEYVMTEDILNLMRESALHPEMKELFEYVCQSFYF